MKTDQDKLACHRCGKTIMGDAIHKMRNNVFCEDCCMEIHMTPKRKTHWQYLTSIKTEYLRTPKEPKWLCRLTMYMVKASTPVTPLPYYGSCSGLKDAIRDTLRGDLLEFATHTASDICGGKFNRLCSRNLKAHQANILVAFLLSVITCDNDHHH